MEFGDCALLFRLMLWIKNTRLRLIIRDEINRKIQKRFKEEGINIPFPIREVYLHNTR
jgi:small-conductance mechanosensitive channel